MNVSTAANSAPTTSPIKNMDILSYLKTGDNQGFDMISSYYYNKNKYIYMPEDRANYIYYINKGRVKLGLCSDDGKQIIKSILKEGEIFGELALFGSRYQQEFAQVMEDDTQVFMIPLAVVKKQMTTDREFCNQITQIIGKKLIKAQKRLESFVFKDAQSRIIEFLRDLVVENGQRVGYEMLVPQFYTHQEIAHLTNTSRQTVTTVLSKLKSKNLIYIRRKKLLVRDLSLLEKMIA